MNLTRFVQPLFLIVLLYTSFSITSGPLTGCLLIFAAAIGFRSIFKLQVWQAYALSKLMIIYLVWLFIVAFSSTVLEVSSFMVVALACLPVIYLIATNTQYTDENLRILRITFFVVAIGFAILAIWQVYHHIGKGFANGPLQDRNAFAALLNLVWFPTVHSFVISKYSTRRWLQPTIGIGLFIISIALFATTSRGGLLTWGMLLPFMLWASYKYTSSKRQVGYVLLIAFLAYFSSAILLNSTIADRTFEFAQDSSTAARLMLWKSTIQMAIAHPFTGLGWGTFMIYYPAYRSPLEYTTSGQFTHNDYLQLAAEGGVLALLLQLAILVGILIQFKRNFKSPVNAISYESIALLLGVLAIFIQAGVNFIFYFAFMNIIVALYLARVAQLTEIPRNISIPQLEQISPSIKRIVLSFIVLIIASPYVLRLFSELSLRGSQPARQVINLVAPNISEYDLASIISAIKPTDSNSQDFLLNASETLFADKVALAKLENKVQQELFDETFNRYELMRAQKANSPYFGLREVKFLVNYHQYASGEYVNQDAAFTKAFQVLNDNLKADPFDTYSMIELSRLHLKTGQAEEAKRTLQLSVGRALDRRYQQHIEFEILRQRAAPRVIAELEALDKQLLTVPDYDSKHVDARLKILTQQIK